jgi:rhodanese-related sulfurtransferase
MIDEIDAQALQARIAVGAALHLLDIRSHGELVTGGLPQAQHLPMHLIPLRLHELPRDREVVLYCRSGARSYHACAYLIQQGFRNVINLRDGILGWAQQGFALEPVYAA